MDCYANRMAATIRPEAFGVEPSDYNNYATGLKTLTVNGDTCTSLTWSNEENLFKLNAQLFECNMQVGEVTHNTKQ